MARSTEVYETSLVLDDATAVSSCVKDQLSSGVMKPAFLERLGLVQGMMDNREDIVFLGLISVAASLGG